MTWIVAAKVEEVAEGKPKLIQANGKEIGVFCEDGEYFAVLNYCPHRGAPICLGKITGVVTSSGPGEMGYDHERKILRCPWHHWEFDLRSGEALAAVKQRIKTYPVMVRDGEILIRLSI